MTQKANRRWLECVDFNPIFIALWWWMFALLMSSLPKAINSQSPWRWSFSSHFIFFFGDIFREKGFFLHFEHEKWKLFHAFTFFRRRFQGQEKFFTSQQKKSAESKKGIYFRCRGRSRRKHFPKRRLTSSRMTFLSEIMEISSFFRFSLCHGCESLLEERSEGGHLVNNAQNGAKFNHAQIKVQSVRCYVTWKKRKKRDEKKSCRADEAFEQKVSPKINEGKAKFRQRLLRIIKAEYKDEAYTDLEYQKGESPAMFFFAKRLREKLSTSNISATCPPLYQLH